MINNSRMYERIENRTENTGDEIQVIEPASGMTIRQEFVRSAMQGLLADITNALSETPESIAKTAVEFADACIKLEAETRKNG